MNTIKTKLFIALMSVMTSALFSQVNDQTKASPLEHLSVSKRFDYVLKKSTNFIGSNGAMYEAVRQSTMLSLRAHVMDSLQTTKRHLAESSAMVAVLTQEIEQLQERLKQSNQDLKQLNAESDRMYFLGISTTKIWYRVISWGIIINLLVLVFVLFYKFTKSHTDTVNSKKAHDELLESFDQHRKTALEREQKVRRQLQDEINKQRKNDA